MNPQRRPEESRQPAPVPVTIVPVPNGRDLPTTTTPIRLPSDSPTKPRHRK